MQVSHYIFEAQSFVFEIPAHDRFWSYENRDLDSYREKFVHHVTIRNCLIGSPANERSYSIQQVISSNSNV